MKPSKTSRGASVKSDGAEDHFPWHAFMHERKMVVLKDQTTRNRKTLCVLNDMAKSRLSQYNTMLSRERGNASFQLYHMTGPMKQMLLRRRITQRCLQRLRSRMKDVEPEKQFLGRYQGVSIADMNDEVNDVISDLDPQHRRMRRVKRLRDKDQENQEAFDEKSKILLDKMSHSCVTTRRDPPKQKPKPHVLIPKPAIITRSPSDHMPMSFKRTQYYRLPPIVVHDNMKHDQGRLRKPGPPGENSHPDIDAESRNSKDSESELGRTNSPNTHPDTELRQLSDKSHPDSELQRPSSTDVHSPHSESG